MPVFEAHVPAGRFSDDQKRGLADALNQSLVQGLGIPEEDRFVMITEHSKAELFVHPTFPNMNRSQDAMIITVLIGDQRGVEDKQKLATAINELAVEALGISPDDIFISLIPMPINGFSFGRGELALADGVPQW